MHLGGWDAAGVSGGVEEEAEVAGSKQGIEVRCVVGTEDEGHVPDTFAMQNGS